MFSNCETCGLAARSVLAVLISVLPVSCSKDSGGQQPATRPVESAATQNLDAPLDSANYYLAPGDLDQFQPGRSRSEILQALHWRGASVGMAQCQGKTACVITYALLSSGPPGKEGEVSFHALFVDNKFAKLVHWLPGGRVEDALKLGDYCGWFTQALQVAPVTIDDLKKEATAVVAPAPPEHGQTDVGLTIAWLLMSPVLVPALQNQAPKAPSVEDYKRNAALRDQFNAGRLDIGMTEAQVESVLKARPLEEGTVDAGRYKIYGSNESFNIDGWLHFFNVLVVFREGKATVVYSCGAGHEWRDWLGKTFTDLPKAAPAEKSG